MPFRAGVADGVPLVAAWMQSRQEWEGLAIFNEAK